MTVYERLAAMRCATSRPSRWRRSIEGPDVGAKLLVSPSATTPLGSLGDPDLDRVVARDAVGELAAGRHRASATTARTARPASEAVRVFIE